MKKFINTLWFLAESNNVGGAETRLVKVASTLAYDNRIKKINILVTPELKLKYQNHKVISKLLDHPKIEVIVPSIQKSTVLSFIKRVVSILSLNISVIEKFVLRNNSWFEYLNKNAESNDVFHCYIGDNARNGLIQLTQRRKNKVIIEITNNRYLKRLSKQFKLLSNKTYKHHDLLIRSVSKTVHENWTSEFENGWFKKRKIDVDYYRGAFIELKNDSKNYEKKNVIIFPHRFVNPKNGILFSLAINELLNEGHLHGWKILLRGNGPQKLKIESILKQWIDEGSVEIGFSNTLFREFEEAKIVVSLIETGSYPSQSIFEAMQKGCALLLSDTGNTAEEFNHEDIFLTDLNKMDVKNNLLKLTNKTEIEFKRIEKEMRNYFKWFLSNRNQVDELKKIYFDI